MNRTIVIVFVLIVALPLAGSLAGVDGGDAEAENRALAAFPHWDGSWTSVAAYPDALTAWFDDHFAFRASLVRWSSSARLFGFGMSPTTAVLKGSGRWLYYADDGGMVDYANAPPMTDGEVGAWREALVRAHEWLQTRRIAYVFMIAPDKHVIYPSYIPATIRRVSHTSRTDQIYDVLAGTGVAAVDVRPDLVRASATERLFDFTDTHWNDRGALIAYQRLIEAVRAQAPSTPPAWTRADFNAQEVETEGQDLAGMMGLKRVLRELELRLVPTRPRRARVVDPPGAAPMEGLGRIVTQIDDPALPRAVIFRDSFASRLAPFLSEHFSRAVYLWQNDFDAEVVLEEHPDVVIQEIVGRHLYEFLASPELVPR